METCEVSGDLLGGNGFLDFRLSGLSNRAGETFACHPWFDLVGLLILYFFKAAEVGLNHVVDSSEGGLLVRHLCLLLMFAPIRGLGLPGNSASS